MTARMIFRNTQHGGALFGAMLLSVVAARGVDTNLAVGKESYMVALTDAVNRPSHGNDDNLSTEVITTTRTVDAYWEVDLGETFALSSVSPRSTSQ